MAKDQTGDELTLVEPQLPTEIVSLDSVLQEFNVPKQSVIQYDEKCKIADNNLPFFITEVVFHEEGKFKNKDNNPDGAFWELTVDFQSEPRKLFVPWNAKNDQEYNAYQIMTVQRGATVGPATLRRVKSDYENDWFVIEKYEPIPNQSRLMPF